MKGAVLIIRIFRSDLHWGFLAQGLSIASGLLLLPVILHYLPTEEVGLWFVFMSLAGLAQLLELGFQPTIARNVAYVYAGAQKLSANGCIANTDNSPMNIELLQQLFAAAKKIYWRVSLGVLAVLVVIGSAYITTIIPQKMSLMQIILAWLAFASGYVINFYYGYFNGFLQGRGSVTESNKIIVASRVTMIILGCLFLVSGMGLIGLGIASLLSSVINRLLAGKFFWNKERAETAELAKVKVYAHNPLISIIWPNARKLGWVNLGAFLITRANVLIATSFLGLVEAASYGLTFQILTTFASLSTVVLNLKMPRISADQVSGRNNKILKNFGQSLVSGWLVFIICAGVLIVFGSVVLAMIGSKTHLLDTNLLALLSIIMFFEMNHSFFATYLTTFNEIPFVRAALISGVGVVMASVLAVSVFHLGVWGMVLAQGIVQAAYNNWRWPMMAMKRMGCSFLYLLKSGLNDLVGKVRHG